VKVKVSAASMRQLFHRCTEEFIRDTCHARCCRSSVDPTGIAVFVSPDEVAAIRAAGGVVSILGRLAPVNRRCPFQHESSHLCTIHASAQPFGCKASPFTFNSKGTMLVRNRYRLLSCFQAEGAEPAYKAHFRALVALLGEEQAERLAAHLDAGGGDFEAEVADSIVQRIWAKTEASSSAKAERRPG
jgi:Fe-S-cluster containining protein